MPQHSFTFPEALMNNSQDNNSFEFRSTRYRDDDGDSPKVVSDIRTKVSPEDIARYYKQHRRHRHDLIQSPRRKKDRRNSFSDLLLTRDVIAPFSLARLRSLLFSYVAQHMPQNARPVINFTVFLGSGLSASNIVATTIQRIISIRVAPSRPM